MKKIKIFLSILGLISASVVFGQQDPQYTQYMYNMNILNPAYAGSNGVASLGVLGRTQWVGLPGAPKTVTIAGHAPLGNSLGIGFSIIHDEIGPVKENNIYVDLSYTLKVTSVGRLAFGFKAGASLVDVKELLSVDVDPDNVAVNRNSPNIGAGFYYYAKKFYLGLSIPNFFETLHLKKGNGTISSASQKMHYFLTSGYVFNLGENIKLKPSTMIKTAEGAPISIDLSANLIVDDKVEFGLSHRLDDSLSAIVGFQVNKDFRIGYAYDLTLGSFGDYNAGSHELMMVFSFNKKNVKSPRFF